MNTCLKLITDMEEWMKRSLVILLFFALALSAGCSKKAIKPVPEGAVYYNEANGVIQALLKGYINKDAGAMKAASTDKGYAGIAPDFEKFDSVKLSFTTKWIDVAGRTIDVNVAWEGVWTKGDKKDSERGMAVFELAGTPPRLNAVLSGNPFVYPKDRPK
ncbi:MAG: hypothetical protein M0033_05865 [Nitrospiraceae bacterium]|nr:hypothetical protein [Nitrospiraceae bacterium]